MFTCARERAGPGVGARFWSARVYVRRGGGARAGGALLLRCCAELPLCPRARAPCLIRAGGARSEGSEGRFVFLAPKAGGES